MIQTVRKSSAHLREVIALIWTDATGFVRFRLVVALLLIMIASATTALGPVALKLVVDAFTGHSPRAVGAIGRSSIAARFWLRHGISTWSFRTNR